MACSIQQERSILDRPARRVAAAVACAFSGPLLGLTGEAGGGFHFRGKSSIGKSTALAVAGSVWGGSSSKGYIESWRATANALESVAELHNDIEDEKARIHDRAGFKRKGADGETEYLILPEVFKSAVCEGYNVRTVVTVLIELVIRRRGTGAILRNVKPCRNWVASGSMSLVEASWTLCEDYCDSV